ncbi:hypothetical protein ABGT15_04355 [Flavobacterium enshiense]|uniref:hypothetical protein n=1 Tax=Flavobacterium enshiense TaxID=1341165 RepID=UPI00345D9793
MEDYLKKCSLQELKEELLLRGYKFDEDGNIDILPVDRFILEYDVSLSEETKIWIIDNCKASMVSPNNDSSQYCLIDILDKMYDLGFDKSLYVEDYRELQRLSNEGVSYIEICY